jgi:hypothetical protein
LATRFYSCDTIVIATGRKGGCLRGVPRRTECMCTHVGDGGGLLGRVGRCSACWRGRFSSGGTSFGASTAHCFADVEFPRSKPASLFDRRSHSPVAGHGVFVDDKNVLRAIRRPRRDGAPILNAQSLR